MIKTHIRKGFTLLEILLVIALIGILVAISLVAINPNKQLAQSRDLVRKADINKIYEALEYYRVSQRTYPAGITETKTDICDTGTEQVGGVTNCSGKVDLRVLVPKYLVSIPTDPSGGAYQVYINSSNSIIGVEAPGVELVQSLAVNPILATTAPSTTTPTPTPTPTMTATGGNITTINQNGIWYKVHTFTSNGTFTCTAVCDTTQVLVVGGGGSGGSAQESGAGGGGGGGGVVYAENYPITATSYSITVGSGGASVNYSTNGNAGIRGNNGGNSIFGTITAIGGGGGGAYPTSLMTGLNGGSGGGAGGGFGGTGGTGTQTSQTNATNFYTNNGGNSTSGNPYTGGGGGGAGAPGGASAGATGGAGGSGILNLISGSGVLYGAGGGASGGDFNSNGGAGGSGGGGAGGNGSSTVGTAGTAEKGNGGGGANKNASGAGGSGIVIIRYPTSAPTPTPTPAPTPTPTPTIVQNGLVLHLDAGNTASYPGTGTIWTDLSGNNNNGTLVNGVGYNSANGGSLTFDGVDDYVNVPTTTSIDSCLASDFTYEMWTYLRLGGFIYGKIFAKGAYIQTTGFNGLGYTTSSKNISFQYGNPHISIGIATNVTENNWYHIVITRSGSSFVGYINGIQTHNSTNTTNWSSAYPLRISANSQPTPDTVQQNVGVFRQYNIGFTSQQVEQNFNATKGRFGL